MISFVNPRSSFLDDEAVMPPLGIMYLSGMLKACGIDAQLLIWALETNCPMASCL